MIIGTLTVHKTTNYGAVLQAYALQSVLKEWEYNSEVIDYWLDFHGTAIYGSDLIKKSGGLSSTKEKLKDFARYLITTGYFKKDGEDRKRRTIKFIQKFIPLSKQEYRDYKELAMANHYSCYICGSDQIWNPQHLQRAFTLDFVPEGKKKIAYAASFGAADIPRPLLATYKKMFNEFDAISVREKEGVDIVRRVSRKNATLVLDPTLLMNPSRWDELGTGTQMKGRYLFCYILGDFIKLAPFLKRVSNKMGMKVVVLNGDNSGSRIPLRSIKLILRFYTLRNLYEAPEFDCRFDSGPAEFIQLIRGADCVFTDSFHGMTLAIAFKKPFNVVINTTSARALMSARVKNLAKILGLENQIHDELPDMKNLLWDIDWEPVHTRLAIERAKSENFLKTALNK
jgi:hypothetical protein